MPLGKILKLQVTNFRNLDGKILEFSQGINCIFGPNGNGKTNILEAIHFLSHQKSFRKNAGFPQMLSMDCEQPQILYNSVYILEEDEQHTLSGKVTSEKNYWYKDGQKLKRFSPLAETLFINPFDSQKFHSTPSFRRQLMDQIIGMTQPSYKKSLARYQQALRYKNALLGKKNNDTQISVYNKQLAEITEVLLNLKIQFLNELNPILTPTFASIFSEEHELKLNLEASISSKKVDAIYQELQSNLSREHVLGHAEIGPHRDDYLFLFDGLSSYDFCSLGQQKMSFLSLLFAYVELFRYKLKAYPIVLIDDVSGELDSRRWKYLIDYVGAKKFQVFITTANEAFQNELEKLTNARRILVQNGHVSQLN